MAPKPLLIVQVGSTLSSLIPTRGDFDQWFAQGTGLPARRIRVVRPPEGEALPEPGSLGGVLVTGSAAMVTQRLEWSEQTAAWMRRVVAARVPLLGVCYGHQLLVHALGGEVGPIPCGLEIGTARLRLTRAGVNDRLLGGGGPGPLLVQVTHQESVLRLPPGDDVRLLGSTERDPFHAVAVGPAAWGVQFHPEFDAAIIRAYLRERAGRVREAGLDPVRLAGAAEDSLHGTQILRRFAALVA